MCKKNIQRKNYILFVFEIGMSIITVCALLSLFATYAAGFISPAVRSVFSLFALIAPIVFLINIVLFLYWVIRWRVFWILLTLIPLLLGSGFIFRVFQPTIRKEYKKKSRKSGVNIVSYNVHGFIFTGNSSPTMAPCLDFVKSYKPDILCLQEFQTTNLVTKLDVDARLKRLKYSVIDYRIKSSYGGFGLAIYSAYPIVRSGRVVFDGGANSMLWADILIAKKDTLRVFNSHLQTTSIGTKSLKYIENHKFVSNKNDSLELNIFEKLIRNNTIRAGQVDSIAPMIANSPHPVVVCGDFNDTPMSYTYQVMRGELKDSFVDGGSGISSTFNGLFNLLRIDYIFHSKEFVTESYEAPHNKFSDHNPVVVNIQRAKLDDI